MAALGGLLGVATLPSTGTMHFRNWSIDYAQAVVDTTAFGNAGRAFVPGITEWSGTAEGTLDDTTIAALPLAGVSGVFKVDGTRQWAGTCIITNIGPTVQVDGEATATFAFQGTGTLTPT